MATLVTDPTVEEQIRACRAASGADRFDEVWEGTYVMAPLPNNDHQDLVGEFDLILRLTVKATGLGRVFPGANVSDREFDWEQNYRCPDVVVFLKGSRVKDCRTHFVGGPDFLIEIASPRDKSRDKLPFYSGIGVREVLIVDRDPWRLELYRLKRGKLKLVGTSQAEKSEDLVSDVIRLSFRLIPAKGRPRVEVSHRDGVHKWIV